MLMKSFWGFIHAQIVHYVSFLSHPSRFFLVISYGSEQEKIMPLSPFDDSNIIVNIIFYSIPPITPFIININIFNIIFYSIPLATIQVLRRHSPC